MLFKIWDIGSLNLWGFCLDTFLWCIYGRLLFSEKKLSGKSLTFQFAFCSTVSILLVNTAVLGLGLVHILKGWLIACIFYGIFIISVLKNKELRTSFFSLFRTLFAGTLGGKTLIFRLIYNIKECIIRTLRCLDKKTKGRKLEYSVLSVLIIFAVAYFSYGAFQCHSYGWGGYVCSPCMDLWAEGRKIFQRALSRSNALFVIVWMYYLEFRYTVVRVVMGEISCAVAW